MKINKLAMIDLLAREDKIFFGEHLNSYSKITLEEKLKYLIDDLTENDYFVISDWENYLSNASDKIIGIKNNIKERCEQETEMISLLRKILDEAEKDFEKTKHSLLTAKRILQRKKDKIIEFQTRVDDMIALSTQIKFI